MRAVVDERSDTAVAASNWRWFARWMGVDESSTYSRMPGARDRVQFRGRCIGDRRRAPTAVARVVNSGWRVGSLLSFGAIVTTHDLKHSPSHGRLSMTPYR